MEKSFLALIGIFLIEAPLIRGGHHHHGRPPHPLEPSHPCPHSSGPTSSHNLTFRRAVRPMATMLRLLGTMLSAHGNEATSLGNDATSLGSDATSLGSDAMPRNIQHPPFPCNPDSPQHPPPAIELSSKPCGRDCMCGARDCLSGARVAPTSCLAGCRFRRCVPNFECHSRK